VEPLVVTLASILTDRQFGNLRIIRELNDFEIWSYLKSRVSPVPCPTDGFSRSGVDSGPVHEFVVLQGHCANEG